MKKRLALVLLLVLPAAVSQAQEISHDCYRYARALRGLTRLFIDTGEDLESRRHLIEVILKEFPHLTIVSHKEEAEMLIHYSDRVERREPDKVLERRVEAKVEVVTQPGQYRGVSTSTGGGTCGLYDKTEARRYARVFISHYEAANR